MEKYDENLKKEFYDEKSGLWYELQGDYYYPMIAVQKQEKIEAICVISRAIAPFDGVQKCPVQYEEPLCLKKLLLWYDSALFHLIF